MSIKGITDHAAERSVERYGFAPDASEVLQILTDCRTGIAPCLRKNEIGRQHVAKVRGKLMIVCLAIAEPVIITVFPRDYFNSGSAVAHMQKRNICKQKSRTAQNAEKPEYRRGRWKAVARQLAEDI